MSARAFAATALVVAGIAIVGCRAGAPELPAHVDACAWLAPERLRAVLGVHATAQPASEKPSPDQAGSCRWTIDRQYNSGEYRESRQAGLVLELTTSASLRAGTGLTVSMQRWLRADVRIAAMENRNGGVYTEPEAVSGPAKPMWYVGLRQPRQPVVHRLYLHHAGWMVTLGLFGGSREEAEAIAALVVQHIDRIQVR